MEGLSSTDILNHYRSSLDHTCLLPEKEQKIKAFFAGSIEAYAHGESLTTLVDLARQVMQIVECTPSIGNKQDAAEEEWKKNAASLIVDRVHQAYAQKANYYNDSMVGKVVFAILQKLGLVRNLATPSMQEASAFTDAIEAQYDFKIMKRLSSADILDHYQSSLKQTCLPSDEEQKIKAFFAGSIEAYALGKSLTTLVDLARQVMQIIESTPSIKNKGDTAEKEWKKNAASLIVGRVHQAYVEKVNYYYDSMVGKVVFAILQKLGLVRNLATPSMQEASAFTDEVEKKYHLLTYDD
jgi:hypothetical protein